MTRLYASAWAFALCVLFASIVTVQGADPIGGNNNNNNNNQQQSASVSASASTTSIPQTAAAGGIVITQPAEQASQQSYYKIASGVNVTFGWNFTSIIQQPSSLTVQAYNTEMSNTYLITVLPGTATSVVWSPWDLQSSQRAQNKQDLTQATYRLQIYDERGLNTGIVGGRMTPNQKVQFALYIPQPYTSLAGGYFCKPIP